MSSRMFGIASLFPLLFYVCSGQSSGDLRLWRNGESSPDFSYGRLQILVGGKWSEVCDTGFGKTEADVACHQLQYGDAVDEMAGSGDSNSVDDVSDLTSIGLSEIYCPTSDYLHLLRCSFQIGQHDCAGKGYTMLECSSNRIWDPPYVGQIRLVGTNYTSQGLAQIYCGEAGWGLICANYPFSQTEADTVCRQLGYTHAANYRHLYYNIEVNTSLPLLLSDIDCSKEEDCLGACRVCYQSITDYCYSSSRLTIECEFDTLHYAFGSNVSTCEYAEGGYIEARPRLGEVRVSNVGVAEVFHNISGNRTWNSICTSGVVGVTNTGRVANTFCTQYGYNQVISYSSVSVDNGNAPFLSILCDIEHPHLLWCNVSVATSCSSILSVSCGNNESDYYTGQIRLRDGDYPSEGRVEIYVYGNWSSIYIGYYASYYQDEADSVCRQLGYTGADFYTTGTLPGSGDIHISYPSCYNAMQCFSQCLNRYDFVYDNYYYSHIYDLAVNCTFNISQSYSAGFYGTSDACSIIEPERPTLPDEGHPNIVAAIVIPLVLLCLIGCIITVIVCAVVGVTKRANRRTRAARAAGQVGYSPQTGAQVGYNPQGAQIGNTQQTPAAGGGGMIMIAADQVPPQGLLLMPPGASAGQYPNSGSEEKVPPSYSEEVLPSSSNL